MMRRLAVLSGVALFAALFACGQSKREQPTANPAVAYTGAASERQVAFSKPVAASQGAAQAANLAAFWAAQKLIRNAEMQIRVSDVQRATRSADSIAQAQGGVLADSHFTQDSGDGRQTRLVIRVPSERFAETTAALRRLGDVRTENVNTQDITKEYADLDTRLAVQQQTVTRLRGLLDTRTAKLSDVLEVERELSRAVSELEQMKGARRYYDQQVALSTLSLVLFEVAGTRAAQFTAPVANAWRDALQVLGTSIAGVIYTGVLMLPWGVIAMVLWWTTRRWRRGLRTRSGLAVSTETPSP